MRFGMTVLAVILTLGLVACGDGGGGDGGGGSGGAAGTYVFDKAALENSIIEATKKRVPGGGDLPPQVLQGIKDQVAKSNLTLVLAPDGTFTVSGAMGDAKLDARGTWEVKDGKLITVTTHEDGKKKDKPDEETAEYADGKITMTSMGPFPMVLIRE